MSKGQTKKSQTKKSQNKTGRTEAASDSTDDNKRKYSRRSVLWPAKLEVRSVLWPAKVFVNLHEFSCQVSNFSLGGARLRIDLPLKEGTNVILSLPERGEIPATVVWVEGGLMGLEFNAEIDKIREMFADRLTILGLDKDSDD